jgi:1-deoxy-D-xylulose-5-phosphate synthase
MKPLDEAMIKDLALASNVLITIEEGSKGGFGAHVLDYLTDRGLMDHGTLRFRAMYIPDVWIEAGTQKEQYDIAQLAEEHIIAKVEGLVNGIKSYRPKGVIEIKAEAMNASSTFLHTVNAMQ